MKKLKKVVRAALAGIIVLTAICITACTNNDSVHINETLELTLNSEMMEKSFTEQAKAKMPDVNTYEEIPKLSVTFLKNNAVLGESNTFDISGNFEINNEEHILNLSGDLYVDRTLDGVMGIFGTASGYLDSDSTSSEARTVATIQYAPELHKIYVFLSVGTLSETTEPNFYIFGEEVPEISSIVNEILNSKDKYYHSVE